MSRPKYRLIGIDLDGTLLCPLGTVTPRTRAAVHKAREAGFTICFATGRSWRESRHILSAVGHEGVCVFVTGAMVVDTQQGVTLHRRLMGAQLAREVSAFLEQRGQTVLALQDDQQAIVDYLATDATDLNEATQQWLKLTRTVVQRRSDLAVAAHSRTVRISIVASDDEVDRCENELKQAFRERVVCQSLLLRAAQMRVLEVFDPAVSKWDGLLQVAVRRGIAQEQIVAVGDDVNDVSMIQRAALGVAMGNAVEQVKSAAHRVIGHNAEDGLAVFLEELADCGGLPLRTHP